MAIDDDTCASGVPLREGTHRSIKRGPASGEDGREVGGLDGPLVDTSVIHSLPGRVRLRVPALKTYSHLAKGLQALLSDQPGVIEATVNCGCQSVTVLYEPTQWSSDLLCGFLRHLTHEELEQRASTALADEEAATASSPTEWLQPWRFLKKTDEVPDSNGAIQTQVRSGYWTAGYISMVVGAILVPVPLVPGIPLLMLASYLFTKAGMSNAGKGPELGDQAPRPKE